MLKSKKTLILLTLLFIPVLGFSQESKNKPEENKEIPSMIAIREEGRKFEEGATFFWNTKDFLYETGKNATIGAVTGAIGGAAGGTVTLPVVGTVTGAGGGAVLGTVTGAVAGATEYIIDEIAGKHK